MSDPRRSRIAVRIGGAVIGTVVLVGAWWIGSAGRSELILPSPLQTWRALVDLATDGTLAAQLGLTLGRSVVGVAVAVAVGLVWGALSGRSEWFAALTQPALSTLMALPPVVLVALAMVWLGPGGSVTRMVVGIVALPLIVVAVQEAVRNVDRDLLEMARSFELPRATVLRHIVVPAVTSPVLAATSVTIGQALRVAVMAELLSATTGVGAQVALARANLETADLFAWALTLVVVAIVIEVVVLRPLTGRLLRWREPTA